MLPGIGYLGRLVRHQIFQFRHLHTAFECIAVGVDMILGRVARGKTLTLEVAGQGNVSIAI